MRDQEAHDEEPWNIVIIIIIIIISSSSIGRKEKGKEEEHAFFALKEIYEDGLAKELWSS